MKKLIIPAIIVALLVAAAFTMFGGEDRKELTAHFPRTVSVYEGSDLRVRGVPIGTVDKVTPSGTDVIVEMSYDSETKVPANAKAVIVAPSVVGDRYVQLVWEGSSDGPQLKDGAVLDLDKTSVPLELDEIYQSLDDLTVALGPEGANEQGALSELLEQTAANFSGQGEKFNQTIKDLGKLTGTLDNNKEELFGAAARIEDFVSTLAENDTTVRAFNESMADIAELLAGERDELSTSLKNLATAMAQVSTFVEENEGALGRNIRGLNRVAKVLVKQRGALDEILQNAPVAVVNLAHTYNPQAGTLDTRANLTEVLNQLPTSPATVLCSLLQEKTLCGVLTDLLPRTSALEAIRPPRQTYDPTLGGLAEVIR